jgi:putative NIF3 family GTP cyclohydrolase 1 type 2
MADWLCDVVTGSFEPVSNSTVKAVVNQCDSSMYSAPSYPEAPIPTVYSSPQGPPHTRSTIHPSPPASISEGFESAGAGRLVTFNQAQPLVGLIDNIAHGIGLPGGIPIALPQGRPLDNIDIKTVGMCPGSGSGVLLRGDGPIPDLLLTGEMSHHEALAATERGSVVISLSHTNSERGYLRSVMQHKLFRELEERWRACFDEASSFERAGEEVSSVIKELYTSQGKAEVLVSTVDRDPYGIMIWRGN